MIGTLTIGSGVLVGATFWLSHQNQRIESYSNRFYPGTVVNGVSVEGKTISEVEAQLTAVLTDQASIELSIKADVWKETKSLDELGIHYVTDLEELATLEAKQQERSWFEKLMALQTPLGETITFELALDDEKVTSWVESLADQYAQESVEPTLVLKQEEGEWVPELTEGQEGASLDVSLILERIEGLPTLPWKGAHQVKASFQTIPFEPGVEDLEEVVAPIGTWTSYFNPAESRATNVKRAAELIHNSVLLPGETFSYNEKVLPANASNGYVYGTIFLNGERVPGMAGGICQVSSTLYNAVLEAGIKADERTNHSLFVDYVPYGQDATMNDSGLDFKFTNPYEVPILIQATTTASSLTMSLWSNPSVLNGLDYKAYTEAKGSKTYDTYLQAFNQKGELVSSEFLHTSKYR